MKITSFDTFLFELPLKQKLIINNKKISSRNGLVVKITDDSGNFGYGEISPLPSLHTENISQAINQLSKVKNSLLQKILPKLTANFEHIKDEWLHDMELAPSVRFGVESALYNLYSAEQNIPVFLIFSANHHQKININGLLTGSAKEITDRVKVLIGREYDTLKVKVGRESIDDEIRLIKLLLSIIKNKAILRLDANRKWSLPEAVSFLNAIGRENIEYIEEPLSDPSELDNLYLQTNFPIALDESLSDINPTDFVPPNWCKAFVLKPTKIGSIQKTLQFIQLAEKYKISPIISDTFQSGVGLSMLAAISASIKNNQPAMGLDTYNWLETDILQNPIKFNQNKLVVNQVLDYSNKIDFSLLDPVILKNN